MEDLGSANGTFVNGVRQQMQQRSGDRVTEAHLSGPINGDGTAELGRVDEHTVGAAIVPQHPGTPLPGQDRMHP
ncbi:FHA domain-containing protein [Nocardia cyriacigeorgica]|uniref:FHA domain-containing protein n=1 Tax=Nocardia cyriacigeorgica TaxID=135487 RepID=UPI0035C6AD97